MQLHSLSLFVLIRNFCRTNSLIPPNYLQNNLTDSFQPSAEPTDWFLPTFCRINLLIPPKFPAGNSLNTSLRLKHALTNCFSTPTIVARTHLCYILRTLHFLFNMSKFAWFRTQQSVNRITTEWSVRRSNPCGCDIFGTIPDWPWDPPNLLCNRYCVYSTG